ncbi:hypothetical protein [Pseudomonas gingeri]|uniref:hypothetical protein n=1 Tax=Pseudomonas gingeri TaxID=117681 RepID=UPI003529AFCA
MATVLETPTTNQPLLDPTLQIYSERQLAVAGTWADHFELHEQDRAPFIRHYLRSTSTTRCWCVALGKADDQIRPALARFGNRLQLFDGQSIWTSSISDSTRISLTEPTQAAAAKLISRFRPGSGDAILTSFSKDARDLALMMSTADLGKYQRKYHIHPIGRNNRYFGTRNRFYLTQIGGALKRFCRYLDQELLFAVRSASCPSAQLYNWLADGDRQRRLQALKAQPVLIPLLVLAESTPWPSCDVAPWSELGACEPEISEEGIFGVGGETILGVAADAGLPINEVIAWLFGVPQSSIRYLGRQRPFHAGSALTHFQREGKDTGWNALLAGAALGNRRPSTKPQWKSFFSTWSKLPWQITQRVSNLSHLFTGCPTDWNDPTWPHIAARLSDLQDLFNPLSESEFPESERAKNLLQAFVSRSSYHQVGRLVDDFHQALNDIREQMDRESGAHKESDEHTRWPTFLVNDTPIDCPNGLQIVELTCPADLWAEHCALDHCVDTYDYRAYHGSCRLLSVRHNGKSLATAEVVYEPPHSASTPIQRIPRHLVTQQLRGFQNDLPAQHSPEQKAYDWFWLRVKTEAIAVNLDWLDMTRTMPRFGDNGYKSRHAQAVVQWIVQRLDNA